MKGKILFVTGLAAGYVLGSKAGRQRYEQIKARATKVWNDPKVQRQVNQVEDFVKEKVPDVAEFVGENVKKVIGRASSMRKGSSAPTGAGGTTAGTTASSAAAAPASPLSPSSPE